MFTRAICAAIAEANGRITLDVQAGAAGLNGINGVCGDRIASHLEYIVQRDPFSVRGFYWNCR